MYEEDVKIDFQIKECVIHFQILFSLENEYSWRRGKYDSYISIPLYLSLSFGYAL